MNAKKIKKSTGLMSQTKPPSLFLSSQMTTAGSSNVFLSASEARIQDYVYLCAINTNVSNFVSVKLSGSHNYLLWKAQMVCLLDSKNMCGIVDSTFATPRFSGTEIMRQYDSLVRGWIFGSVTDDVLVDVIHLDSAKAAWDKLKSIHDPTDVRNKKKMEWSILPVRFPDNVWDAIDNLEYSDATVMKTIKTNAESCSITAALITAITFAAGINMPDVSNKEMGISAFKEKIALIIFVISNAISLFASNTALLVFLSILTTHFAERDKLQSLPRRLFIGIFSFFLCIAAMMVALSATLFRVFCDPNPWKLVMISGLLFIAIAFFVAVQSPLVVDLFKGTYLGIFGKQQKRHAVRDSNYYKNLREVTINGDWSEVESMLQKQELVTEQISSDGCTTLQLAAETGTKENDVGYNNAFNDDFNGDPVDVDEDGEAALSLGEKADQEEAICELLDIAKGSSFQRMVFGYLPLAVPARRLDMVRPTVEQPVLNLLSRHKVEYVCLLVHNNCKSSTTYYTAALDFNRSTHNSHAKTLQVLNLANKGSNLRVFTVAELKTASENFCTASKIGEGVFGSVYKGVIKSLDHHPMQVVVKLTNELLQGQKEWETEINVLGVIEHPNLAKLIGYCAEDTEPAVPARRLDMVRPTVEQPVLNLLSRRKVEYICLLVHNNCKLTWSPLVPAEANTRVVKISSMMNSETKEMNAMKKIMNTFDNYMNAQRTRYQTSYVFVEEGANSVEAKMGIETTEPGTEEDDVSYYDAFSVDKGYDVYQDDDYELSFGERDDQEQTICRCCQPKDETEWNVDKAFDAKLNDVKREEVEEEVKLSFGEKDDQEQTICCQLDDEMESNVDRDRYDVDADPDDKGCFNHRILFLRVSQSPNVEQLRQRILGFLSESKFNGCSDIVPQWTPGYNSLNTVTPTLVVLDDVWLLQVLEQLIFKVPGCKTLVISRIKFTPSVMNATYELELLTTEDAVSLFCHIVFGRTSIHPCGDLIKQGWEKCKGLPLALKVIGALLRHRPEKYWFGAKNRLSRAQPVDDCHESELLNRMRLRFGFGCSPEDKKAEVNFIGRLSQPNLVKLLGYCDKGNELLLVYEFMQKGSLENHLFGRGSTVQPIPWDIQLKISIGAARGLAFLHTSEKQVIYRDFKPSNISLDGSYNAKISDFGLAKVGPSATQSHVTTRVMGTYGYAAPEYVSTDRTTLVLGEGGFGWVHKGWLEDKSSSKSFVIAVKKLNSENMQGLEEWQTEVDFIGRLSHPNLVKLLGYLYKFMQKGSLENHLFGRGSTVQPIPRDMQLKISIGAARGHAFFDTSEKQVVYRDFKASNILLDGSYNAKISDFGLAKVGPSATQSHVTTRVMGTYGYAAPEYVSTDRTTLVLGEGGFGWVHKGWLEDKSSSKSFVIAVKKLNSENMQGLQAWQTEVDFIGRLQHPNLVKLLGYCYQANELLLVYEFMQKGSLENHLFGRGSTVQPIPRDMQLKISIGAARGHAFFHISEKQVSYRDFKASNILLDGSYNAKISDFGLAKVGLSATQSHVTTRVVGTYGYAAPEYVSTGSWDTWIRSSRVHPNRKPELVHVKMVFIGSLQMIL
ncbi:putative transferase, protein kinase RLK-Pelle-RLCK-VIIa-2 family [Helianthus annuus]|nr:putative transferase, protein kinase RLK-Pelle-RLCK-VIIa-2 family [Helianthus annuus]